MTESRISPLDIGILTQVEYGKTHSLRSPLAFIIFINAMPITKFVDVEVLRLRRKELRLFTHPLTVVKNSVLYIYGFVRNNQTTLIRFFLQIPILVPAGNLQKLLLQSSFNSLGIPLLNWPTSPWAPPIFIG